MIIKVGIGSWADKEYTGILYPKGILPKERLATYATHFNHVEVNSTAYVLPKIEIVRDWVKQTPENFTFDIKLPNDFTWRPEKTARQGTAIERLLATFEPLQAAKKLGAFLLLLTADFSPDKRRLEEIAAVRERLPAHRIAVELRNNAWLAGGQRERTFEFFREHALTWVNVDMPRIPGSTLMPPLEEVADPRLAYLRLHGRNPGYLDAATTKEGHAYEYSEAELTEIVARVKSLAARAAEVHVVANNHAQDFAPKTALALKRRLGC